ncbi:hypothetical protein B0H13DRAFT_1857476 [Mycena leptocephala]|nr:hypothetical protein B0H13DRAFT_1857476 [Mycena leptocephala]
MWTAVFSWFSCASLLVLNLNLRRPGRQKPIKSYFSRNISRPSPILAREVFTFDQYKTDHYSTDPTVTVTEPGLGNATNPSVTVTVASIHGRTVLLLSKITSHGSFFKTAHFWMGQAPLDLQAGSKMVACSSHWLQDGGARLSLVKRFTASGVSKIVNGFLVWLAGLRDGGALVPPAGPRSCASGDERWSSAFPNVQ